MLGATVDNVGLIVVVIVGDIVVVNSISQNDPPNPGGQPHV